MNKVKVTYLNGSVEELSEVNYLESLLAQCGEDLDVRIVFTISDGKGTAEVIKSYEECYDVISGLKSLFSGKVTVIEAKAIR